MNKLFIVVIIALLLSACGTPAADRGPVLRLDSLTHAKQSNGDLRFVGEITALYPLDYVHVIITTRDSAGNMIDSHDGFVQPSSIAAGAKGRIEVWLDNPNISTFDVRFTMNGREIPYTR